MTNSCVCRPLAHRPEIARSDTLIISQCSCGQFWLQTPTENRRAADMENALCDVIRSIAKAVKVQKTADF